MSTPSKISAIVFGLILFLPILALLLVAGVVAFVVFGFLLIVGVVRRKIRSLTTGGDPGPKRSKNVRIKR
jgi:hypothetical protein